MKKTTDKQTWKRIFFCRTGKLISDQFVIRKPWWEHPQGRLSAPRCCAPPRRVVFLMDGGRLRIIIIGGRFPNAFSEKFASMHHNYWLRASQRFIVQPSKCFVAFSNTTGEKHLHSNDHQWWPGWLIFPSIPVSNPKSAAVRAFFMATSVQPTFWKINLFSS